MAASVVQNLEGSQNTGLATVTVNHSAATAGSLLILVMGGDDYRTTSGGGRPESSGYTLPTGASQQTFLGHYVWYKVAAGGETSVQYTIGSASPSCWEFYEVSGLDPAPYDTSNGQFAQSSATSYTTPAITPSAGERWLFASIGAAFTGTFTGVDTWLNSFAELNDTWTTLGSGTRDLVSGAELAVTANGSTAYSTGATFSGSITPQARTSIILSFKVAAAGTNANATEAVGTGTANDPAVSTTAAPAATTATATGAAAGPTAAAAGNATSAAATGAASGAQAALAAPAPEATASGTAHNPSVSQAMAPVPAGAVASGTAANPTVSVSSSAAPSAGVAAATGAAHGPLAGQVLFTSETPATATNASDGTPGITTATSLMFARSGQITAVRFFATTTVSGTYTAAVWQVTSGDATHAGTGTLLSSEVMAGTPAGGGWNAIALSAPVDVTPGVLYRIGVHSADGRYVSTVGFPAFASGGLVSGDLTAPFDGSDPLTLGRLAQGTFQIDAALAYPANDTGGQTSYFIDALFAAAPAAAPSPGEASATGAAHDPSVSTSGGSPAGVATAVGTAEWDAGSSISLDLAADQPVDGQGIAYDATVSTVSSASPTAAAAEAAGAGYNPSVTTSSSASAAATEAVGAGAALDGTAAAGVPAGAATAAGAANSPTVSTVPVANAAADAAGAAGAGLDPVAAVQVLSAAAAAVAQALDPSVLIGGPGSASAGAATGSGTAYAARPSKRILRPYAGVTVRPFAGTTPRP